MKVENDFLKKIEVIGLGSRMAMFEPLERTMTVDKKCALLSISRSAHYYEPVPETTVNLAIMEFMVKQYFLTPFYGARKLVVELAKKGYEANAKKVRRLIGITVCKTLYYAPRTTVMDSISYMFPYILPVLGIDHRNHV